MAQKYRGRRRAPQRYNPLSELALIVSQASSPAIKGSAVLAASGGLVAAFAIPANAISSAKDVAAPAEGTVAAISLTARTADVASRSAARPALTAPAATPVAPQTFGAMRFTAVEKPPPPPPPPPAPVQQSTPVQQQSSGDSGSAQRSNSASPSSGSSQQQPAPAPAPAPAPQRVSSGGVLGIAASLTGIPYVYGGSTPAGFDCSGFVQYVFRQAGISLGRTTYQQYAQTYSVSNPQPGDLVFFGGSSPYHVGIYAGNGMMYDSPRTGKSTSLRKIWSDNSISFRRV